MRMRSGMCMCMCTWGLPRECPVTVILLVPNLASATFTAARTPVADLNGLLRDRISHAQNRNAHLPCEPENPLWASIPEGRPGKSLLSRGTGTKLISSSIGRLAGRV